MLLLVMIGAAAGYGYTMYRDSSRNVTSDMIPETFTASKINDMEIARGYCDSIMNEKEWSEESPIANMAAKEGYKALPNTL